MMAESGSTGGDEIEVYSRIRSLFHGKLQEESEEYQKVVDALMKSKKRIIVSLSFLNKIHPTFSLRLMKEPFIFLPPSEAAVCDLARSIAALSSSNLPQEFASIKHRDAQVSFHLGITGWLGSHAVTPRGLTSRLANQIVAVEGIVTRCSIVRPRLTHATFYVPNLDKHFFREHSDALAVEAKSKYAQRGAIRNVQTDSDGNPVEIELGLSFFKDYQRLTLQEMPELTPTGQLPRMIEVHCEHDLVDNCKPGDRVRIYGVMRCLVLTTQGTITSGHSKALLIANNIELLQQDRAVTKVVNPLNTAAAILGGKSQEQQENSQSADSQNLPRPPGQTRSLSWLCDFSTNEIRIFSELAKRPDTLEVVSRSIAPSLNGLEMVKCGLALQLIGGERKELDGLNLRGDIHILLIGDPSCGKSQILRFILGIAPLCLSTTGRGSSAVGLTAAIVADSDTGERRLEAGSLVLADGGIVCIDEFDKMSADDRVSVHEVMEQQRVSINKAGISTVLNARTSILAAANPIYGLFDDRIDFKKQINFPDSLLSRFDLIYLIRESFSAKQDRKIASQILKQLRTQSNLALLPNAIPGQRSSQIQPGSNNAITGVGMLPITGGEKGRGRHQTFVGSDGSKLNVWTTSSNHSFKFLHPQFLKKYIQWCRSCPPPVLTEESINEIAAFYAEIRERIGSDSSKGSGEGRQTSAKAIPTPRLLEATVRLATAHAKLKLHKAVELGDVAEAKKLLNFTLCGIKPDDSDQQASPNVNNKRRRNDDDEEAQVEIGLAELSLNAKRPRTMDRTPPNRRSTTQIVAEGSTQQEDLPEVSSQKKEEILEAIKTVSEKLDEQEWEEATLLRMVNKVQKKGLKEAFTLKDFQAAIKVLQIENHIMVIDGKIYLV